MHGIAAQISWITLGIIEIYQELCNSYLYQGLRVITTVSA